MTRSCIYFEGNGWDMGVNKKEGVRRETNLESVSKWVEIPTLSLTNHKTLDKLLNSLKASASSCVK